ncbi:hypothetical protein M422DRAFT_241997 [Sphaerobolus stellatus SS14]|nr:hypothetical protein M422DRAFT_241997 [Sphaerobolus stellatus SS14]
MPLECPGCKKTYGHQDLLTKHLVKCKVRQKRSKDINNLAVTLKQSGHLRGDKRRKLETLEGSSRPKKPRIEADKTRSTASTSSSQRPLSPGLAIGRDHIETMLEVNQSNFEGMNTEVDTGEQGDYLPMMEEQPELIVHTANPIENTQQESIGSMTVTKLKRTRCSTHQMHDQFPEGPAPLPPPTVTAVPQPEPQEFRRTYVQPVSVYSRDSRCRLRQEYEADGDQSVNKCARYDNQSAPSSEGTGDGEDEAEEESVNSKDSFGSGGKWFVTPTRNLSCLQEMWMPMLEILEIGKLNNLQLTEADFSKKAWRKIVLHHALIKAIPEMHECATSLGISLLDLARLLDKKCGDTRNEDVQRIKDNAQLLQPRSCSFNPSIMHEEKSKRGFNHPQIARFVCPITWLNQFDNDNDFKQKLRDGKVRPMLHDLPFFIFDKDTFDMDNLFESFICNTMLIHTRRMIFIGPKAAYTGIPSAQQGGKGNAARNRVKHMTVGTLAYLATIVYFALRSDATFHAGGGEDFDYAEFYRGLVMTMTEDATPEQLKELLLWWDRKVFPNYADQFSEDEEDMEPVVSIMISGHGLLKAQLCKAALSDSTNQQ